MTVVSAFGWPDEAVIGSDKADPPVRAPDHHPGSSRRLFDQHNAQISPDGLQNLPFTESFHDGPGESFGRGPRLSIVVIKSRKILRKSPVEALGVGVYNLPAGVQSALAIFTFAVRCRQLLIGQRAEV